LQTDSVGIADETAAGIGAEMNALPELMWQLLMNAPYLLP
jgi:hypothetical protein